MAGAGALKRKSVQKRLREIRTQATAPLVWVAQPAWFLGEAIVTPIGDGPRGDDIAAMAAVTEEVYLEALEAAIEAGELTKEYLEADSQERSWARFVAYREGDHSPHPCSCSPACLAKQPAPLPRTSVEPAGERYGAEGVNRRSDPETWVRPADADEADRQRLLRIANEAGPRWFTS